MTTRRSPLLDRVPLADRRRSGGVAPVLSAVSRQPELRKVSMTSIEQKPYLHERNIRAPKKDR